MTRRRYTKDEKARVVGLALVKGQRPASEETGVPLSTLHYWYEAPEFEHLRTTTREEVAERMFIAAQIGVEEMVKGLQDPRTPLRDKTDAASMLAEKYLLFTGRATSRVENRDITERMTPDQVDALADEIDKWLAEQRTEAADG